MRHTLRFETEADAVLVTTSGTASLAGLDAVVVDLLADERYRPGLRLLVDHSQLDWSTLEAEDLLRRVNGVLKEADLIGPSRIALVSADRRLEGAHGMRATDPPWRVFADPDDARDWLTDADEAFER
jgi:hypothetical protein